jgi:hypothetical protein
MQRGRNYTDRGIQKHSEKNQSQCHFALPEFHTDWTGVEPGSPWYKRPAAIHLNFDTAFTNEKRWLMALHFKEVHKSPLEAHAAKWHR